MADELDWHEIIASGNGAGRADDDRGAAPADGSAPLTRRAMREREAAARAAAERDERPLGEQPPAPPADSELPPASSGGRRPDREHVHPDLHALFGHHPNAESRAEEAGVAASTYPWSAGEPDDSEHQRAPRRRRRPRAGLIVGLVLLLIVVGGGVGVYAVAAPKVQSIIAAVTGKSTAAADYSGSGTGKVTVTIKQGDIGSDVATTLHRDGVTASYEAFYKLLLTSQNVQFQPGSYALKHHMSAKAALAALQNPANRIQASIVIPEGDVLKSVEASLVQKAGLSQSDVTAAANDVSAYGLPAGVQSLEGWLFPATYPVNPGWTAKQYFQSMVQTMIAHLNQAGVAPADRQHVLIFASLVQKEAGQQADFPKVARVFQNRLNANMYLQSDATVAYGTGNTNRVTTTDAERNDASNPYNTYKHLGLPPGPISNPGDVAIDAALHPADGSWLYFVTVNLQTGETVFSDTLAEHEQAVAQFQAWLRAHPGYQ